MRRRWWLLAVYLALLLASHAVRWRANRAEPPPEPRIDAAVVGGAGSVPLAYREWGDEEQPAVLLLHGSPGSSRDFASLAPLLADRFRLIAPDLPGFGRSRAPVPDYSVRAHAGYAQQLLDALAIDRAHLVGFSMGGGVALELVELGPERVASVTLLSSIGAQEFELLGSYQINHAIHGAQLLGLTLLHEGVPHFGWLDGSMLDRAYARNFYDTDQRPLRGILERLEVPTLVMHGERDPLVPLAAAREHHRIVPQSELVLLGSDHFMVFRDPEVLATPLGGFLERVESGDTPTRSSADPERLRAAAAPLDPEALPRAGGLTRFVLVVLLALATLVSEDLTCISAGLLVAQGRIDLATAIFACALGIFLGDLALYAVGRLFGRPWLRRAPLRWMLSEERIDDASAWFQRRGPIVILISRFTPGTRLATYLSAGMLETSLPRFLLFFALSVALWTPVLVGASAWIGAPLLDWIGGMPVGAALALPLFVLVLWVLFSIVRSLVTWRGRRLLLGRWRRIRHFEFWPTWLFYVPVALWILWLGLKHRSPTLFTAANPSIPEGGLMGESKHRILDLLPSSSTARYVPLPGELPVSERRRLVEEMLAAHGLELPVVIKPDVGERGRQVRVLHSWPEVVAYLEGTHHDTLAQEYVAGVEVGVFYVRLPDEPAGTLFSITEKRLVEVVGDGESSLERLILTDERAVCKAPLFLRRHCKRLAEVPAAGERVPLVEIGSHSRGAIFLDGRRFDTPELETAVDGISQAAEGIYFGRYDLRAPSEEALREGRGLRVMELNGVSSEATHIYDPDAKLIAAYRTLFEQWRLAFEIGAQNRRRGVRPASVAALIGGFKSWILSRASRPARPPVTASTKGIETP